VVELNVGIAMDDSVGVVIITCVVVFGKVVPYKFTVVPVVVPIHVVGVVSDADPEGRFMIHIDVASEEVVVLVLLSVVVER
jgi:hypothetical protein